VVSCRGVSKRYGDREVVTEFSLDVPRGSCLGLLGPNGAGKTTALRMIYGLTQPSGGSIYVFGEDVSRAPRSVRRRIGVTLQENALVEELTPIENLQVFGRYHLLDGKTLADRIDELLPLLELSDHADVPVKLLSGGYQRRVAIARSLINRPELLILDEPTTGLDPAVRAALWERVRTLRGSGTTVLLTTHYMEEAERLCDEVAVMASGEIVTSGSPRDLISAHLEKEALEVELSSDFEASA
jgi:lipooligosaccharide transport system ATP-binding protein